MRVELDSTPMSPIIMLLVFVAELVVVALATPIAGWVARRLNIIAHPNPDVVTHRQIIPLLGGAAILAAFLPLAWFAQQTDPRWKFVGLGMIPLLLLGLYKDKVQCAVSPILQIAVQILSVLPIIFAGMPFRWTGVFYFDFVLTVPFCLWIINAWNFLDVMDGLAGGVALVAALFFAMSTVHSGDGQLTFLAIGFAGCMAGFLLHNFPPAKIFLGDIGSFTLGLFFVACALFAPRGGTRILASVLFLFVPLFDVVLTTLTRLRTGRSPGVGGREHLSLQLLSEGWSNWKVISAAYLLATIVGLAGIYFFAQV